MRPAIVIVALGGLLYSVADAQRPSSLLCVSAASTGFRFDKDTGQWRAAQFKAEGKYIATQSNTDGLTWDIRPIGSASPLARCKRHDEFNPQALRCSGHEDFWIDTKTLRFMGVYPHGYWDSGQEGEPGVRQSEGYATPHIEIGTCSQI